jgi:hypothetical protein
MSDAEYNAAWSREHFRAMAQQGVWGVPRSGLTFQKRGDKLVLIERMPHDHALVGPMPMSAAELRAYQDEDFEVIRREFGRAGIEVIDGTEGERIDKVTIEPADMPPLDGSRRRQQR